MKRPSLRSCRDISALVLAREDRALDWYERVAIRVHFLICQACPRFQRQVRTLHEGLALWRSYRDDGEDGGS